VRAATGEIDINLQKAPYKRRLKETFLSYNNILCKKTKDAAPGDR